jgi:UDP-N-acetylmuramoyl-tripeptide--D-alanyl-D-alanine ligase
VPDVLAALQQLATLYRQSFHIPLIAIGGSNGKTTTKELVADVLGAHYPCHATRGNLNNHIGLPLTLLAMPPNTEVAVIEMGTNQPGDMAELCQIAEPTHGLLTNIGKEHLEKLIDLKGVKKEEAALYQYLGEHGGCAFINLNEKYLKNMSNRVRLRVFYTQTTQPKPQSGMIEVALIQAYPTVHVAFMSDDNELVTIQTQLFGRHNFQNILTAIALGVYFRVPAPKIKAALEAYKPANNRSQILQTNGCVVWLDAYNANPSSMRAALDSLAAMEVDKKAAILGDMLEVGVDSAAEHQKVLNKAVRMGIRPLVLVGPAFGRCKRPSRVMHFYNAEEAGTWMSHQQLSGALLLIKGSRGIRLEKAIDNWAIQNAEAPT